MKKVVLMLLSAAIYLALPSLAKAQTTGAILGYITDTTGAFIPGVSITVTDPSTGFTRKVTSDETGYYFIPSLPVGTYWVSATMAGFKAFAQKNVVVDVAANVRVDIRLEVGEISEVVEVSAHTLRVETKSPTLGETVEQRDIVGLPLNGRNFLQLAVLQPGAIPGLRLTTNNTAVTPGGSASSPQVNGLRGQSNNYLLDGANNNEAFLGEAGLLPPPDAIQEFRILTNSYSAEYGRGGGSIISVISRSGSNELHGSVYEFLRNDVLDARNFFAQEKSPLRRNQFGFSIGGPIRKDKTFFFGAYEGFRESRKISLAGNVPSLAQRRGDFSALNPAPVSCSDRGAVCDPTTGAPFPGNVIPQQRIGTIAKKILEFFPLPNDASGAPIHRFQGNQPIDRDQFMIRLDHDVSEKHRLMGRYNFFDGQQVQARMSGFAGAIIALPAFRVKDSFRFQNVALTDTYLFSQNLINTARLGYHRYAGKAFFADDPAINVRALGFKHPLAVDEKLAYPTITIAGLSGFGYSTSGPTDRAENTFQFENDIVYLRGKHSLKFGFQLNRIRHTYVSPQGFGIIAGYFGTKTGNPIADMLVDSPLFVVQGAGSADRDWRSFWTQVYFQDDFRVAPRFTVNFGIRYELKTPYKELRNRRATFRAGARSTVFPAASEGQLFFGDPGVTDTTVNLRKRNFAPRFGFAWDIFGNSRTSLRGGYGIFFDTSSFFILHQSVVAPPFLSFYTAAPTPAELPDPFASRPIVSPGSTLAPFNAPYQLTFMDPNWREPYAQQWNLTLQHQFPGNLIFQLAYVGTAGRNLPGARTLNNPIHIPGIDPATGQPFSTPGNAQSRRPFPGFDNLLQLSTEFNSNYNGLQLSARKPFSDNLSLNVAYTYSKVLDTYSMPGPFRVPLNQTVSWVASNPNNLKLEKGRALFDVTQRFVVSWVWDIPVLKNQGGLMGKLLGGWTLNGIFAAQTGFPFSVFDNRSPSCRGNDYALDRTDLTGDPNAGPRTISKWFNTDAFVPLRHCSPAHGNAGRNIVEGPGFQNWDLGLIKKISIKEEVSLEFRSEFYNLFNHPNFDVPVNNIASPSFGRIISTVPGNEREIQFGIKLNF